MKDVDIKKLVALLVIIVAVIVLVVVATGSNKEDKKKDGKEISETLREELSNKSLNYYLNIYSNYNTEYDGIDLLFKGDKTTVSDFSDAQLVNTAMKYIINNNNNEIDDVTLYKIRAEERRDITGYSVYKGEQVKKVIKDLFDVDFENKSIMDEESYNLTFEYLPKYDVYLVGGSELYPSIYDYSRMVVFENVSGTEVGNQVKLEYAVAFVDLSVYGEVYYYNSVYYGDEVFSNKDTLVKIDKDYIDDFDHYIVNLKKIGDNYILDSIEKK